MALPLLLLDENLSPDTVTVLQEAEYQAVWLTQFVPLGATDQAIATAAYEANAVIVTQDLDFGEIFHFSSDRAVGMIVLRLRNQTVERVTKRLLDFLKVAEEQQLDLQGSLFVVEEMRYRVRK